MTSNAEQAVAEARQRFEKLAHSAANRAERDRELAARLQRMTVTASSPGEEVVVTVDHGGHMTDLKISEQGMGLTSEELSRLVMETVRQAGARMGRQVGEALRESWGENDPSAVRTMSAYDRFGDLPEEPERRPSGPWNGGILWADREGRS